MPEKTPVQTRRLRESDWKRVSEQIVEDYRGRKKRRSDKEEAWKEVDRQLAMKHRTRVSESGKDLRATDWMPELEQPLQAQAGEVLTADARRMIFPTDRNFFSSRVALTDSYLERADFSAIIAGDENEVPSRITQEDADALVDGVLMQHHNFYDFRGTWDRLNMEAFKYGTFVARGLLVRPDKQAVGARGLRPREIPVLVPGSIKNTYLDDHVTHTMHEGMMIAPSCIREYWQDLHDLRIAAKKGSADPDGIRGGWMPGKLTDLEPLHEDKRSVLLLEYEGDLVVPRSDTAPVFLPNVTITVVIGRGKEASRVIRFRTSNFNFRQTISHPYHVEDPLSPYGVGPLEKGVPIQKAATEAFNRLMQAAILNAEPPIWEQYQDYTQVAGGGTPIEPGSRFTGMTAPQPIPIGDPDALLRVYMGLKQLYENVVGVNAPRLGEQTKSHQTAFAVDSEIARGTVRTVDYVRSVLYGPMQQWLHMEFEMLRQTMKKDVFYLPKYQGFVELSKNELPDHVSFDVHGAGGPLEEREREQRQQNALTLALQIEITRRQLGEQGMNLEAMQKEIMGNAFADTEQFFAAAAQNIPGGAEAAGPVSPIADLIAAQARTAA